MLHLFSTMDTHKCSAAVCLAGLSLLLYSVQVTGESREWCKKDSSQAPPMKPVNTTIQLQKLREHMSLKNIDAFIIQMQDAHKSEYVSEHDKRVRFISGFSGSKGTAVVLAQEAALFTDGRYFLQADEQLDCNWNIMKMGLASTPSLTAWLITGEQQQRIGYDPELVSHSFISILERDLVNVDSLELVAEQGLIDEVWQEVGGTNNIPVQPPQAVNPLEHLNDTGKLWRTKLEEVRDLMTKNGAHLLLLTRLDDIAWLTNLRGSDVEYNPVFIAFAMVFQDTDTIHLYLKLPASELSQAQKKHMDIDVGSDTVQCMNADRGCIMVHGYDEFYSSIINEVNDIRVQLSGEVPVVWVSPDDNQLIFSKLTDNRQMNNRLPKLFNATSPVLALKAIKNEVEVKGMKNAHLRDSAALIEFVSMLEKAVKSGNAWDEYKAAMKLKEYRMKTEKSRGLSFATISASGSNGAIIHYQPTVESSRPITTQEMYLLDSGGQYVDGTTDVTRTFHFGQPTEQEKEAYTLVLQGHIDVASAVWPENKMTGDQLDAVARMPLRKRGLDYMHGTGHGIGFYLGVHEEPVNVYSAFTKIQENMFFSDEPGYYEDGKFGIRLENIVAVKRVNTKYHFRDRKYHGLETYTLVPYEPNLINYDMLSNDQIDWLNTYNQRCLTEIGEKILIANNKQEAYKWILQRTKHVAPSSSAAAALHHPVLPSIVLAFIVTTICILGS